MFFARRALALILLVEKLAVVLDAADGRDGVGRNLNQVQAAFAGNFQSFERGENAELIAGIVNDAYFARADSFINADELFGRTLIDGFSSKKYGREATVLLSISCFYFVRCGTVRLGYGNYAARENGFVCALGDACLDHPICRKSANHFNFEEVRGDGGSLLGVAPFQRDY